jgi:tetratricopeptide (TPR) repeat protein
MKPDENQELQEQIQSLAKYIFEKFVKNDMPPPDELESEEIREERKKAEIAEMLTRHQMAVREGADLFVSLDQDGTIKPLIEKIRNATVADIVNPNYLNDNDFSSLMKRALEIYQDNKLNEAMNLFAFVAHLFPFQVQPYIAMATITWKQSGIQAAVTIYSQLINCLPNPLMMAYAADCFRVAGETQKAKDTLQKGLKLCELNPTAFAPIAKEIRDSLAQFK